ncbi:Zn-dependent metalloprotease [Kordia periserrulae]|uniref:Zn-dependent metalloprotease n=1 Tax=Kordia periserrulae TaxID=701523 RepID=A0A2T6C5E7_9FLAO|nr:M4 family metallopeptidase [Kordia periserrulae]PTX63516.1 Zn-dependent metalloprotease [Kordia periserrulae]
MKNSILLTLVCLIFSNATAQDGSFGKIPLTKVSASQQKSTPLSILFNDLQPVSGTEFRLKHSNKDAANNVHLTYQQYYNGVKVELGVIKVHQQNGQTISYNGAYFPVRSLSTSAFLPKSQLETTAKQFLKTQNIFWFSGTELATNVIPNPEKVIIPNRKAGTIHMAYALNVGTSNPELQMGTLYVDATSGKVLRYKNRLFQCFEEENHSSFSTDEEHTHTSIPFASGTAATVYSGSQTFDTELDNSNYILEDFSRATGTNWNLSTQGLGYKTGIFTVDLRNSTDLQSTLYDFTDADNNWTAAEMSSNEDQYALDTQWGTELVYDYWKNVHGRNSYEGSNASILSIMHYGSNYNNAAWGALSDNVGYMIYGDGSGAYTPFTSLDVVSHEIGHGVTNSTASLDYELESGALNESLSDIWAMVIENYANTNNGLSKDFSLINEENGGGAIRSMSSPNTYGQPDTYGGTFWTDVSSCTPSSANDYCGVHTNSGVLNYWFWLLSQGGTGTNDLGDSFSVTAIGMDDAAAIVWQMQNNYLTATSDYADARTAAIQAAIDLYGECSAQEQQVTNAFYAVGVGNAFSKLTATVTSNPSDERICETTAASFTAAGNDYTGLQWQVNDGNGWVDLSDDSTYSDTNQLTMNISNAPFSLNGYEYRIAFQSDCGETYSNAAILTVMEYPDATITTQDAVCDTDSGEITFAFPDNDARTNIEFSIDGGSTYPYNYSDNTGSGTVTGLAAGTYDVFVRWGNDECAVDMGQYTIVNLCYTAIPDANFEAALDALGYDDISGDGQVPTYLIETLTSLDVSNKNISDITGIEDFTSLQTLDISDNTMSAIDISTNISLTSLSAQDNNLTAIDVSNNTNLVTLGIARNSITSLDVSNNTQLSELYGASNSITSVDLSNNPNLTIVGLNPNALTSLNVQNGNNTAITTFAINGNPNLTCVLVDDAAYSTTNWTIVDSQTFFNEVICYEEYTTIPDANFEAALDALGYDDISGDGQVPTALIEVLTSLNVSSSGITDLTGIEDFTALESLIVSSNSLTTINTSTLVNLDQIWATGNDLTSLDFSTNVLLDDIRVENNELTSIDLSNQPNLQILQINVNSLTALDVSNNPLLVRLRLNSNSVTSLDLTNNTVLNEFRANDNGMTDLNVQNGNNSNISTFTVTANNLTCILVDDAAYSTTNWTSIDSGVVFSEVYCGNYTAIPDSNFEAALETLGYDDISGDGQVPTNLIDTITFLSVDDNAIADLTGIEDFVSLESLNIGNNLLTNLDVSNQTNLKSLDLNNNQIASLDISANTQLEYLRIDFNNFTTIDISNNLLLETFIFNNNGFTELDVSNHPNIIEFNANYNDLSSLNFKNGNNTNVTQFTAISNPNLECVLVDDATYSTTNWTNIDAQTSFNDAFCYTEYTLIPDANFEAALEALGYDNISGDGQVPTLLIESITSLNVNNQNIADATGLEDFTALQELFIRGNNLSSLDISNLINLEKIWALNNSLTSLDMTNNPLLEDVRIEYNNITSLDFSNQPNLSILQIDNNLLTELDVSNNPAITRLRAENNFITSLDLSNLSVLNELRVSNNVLTSLNVQNGNNTNISTFSVNSNDLYCILVDDVDYSTTNWTNIDADVSFTETSCDYVIVDIDVFLQGALLNPNTGEESLMRDDLRAGSLLNTTSPYSDSITVPQSITLTDNGSDSMVDWVWVELRHKSIDTLFIAGQSAVLQRDGDVVANTDDLATPLTFDGVAPDDYYVVVKHRNHLAIMTSSPISLKNGATTINFTDATNEITYGSNAQTTFGMPTDTFAMWSGNTNEDSVVQYSGTDPDTPTILSEVLNDSGNFLNFPTYAINGYNVNDIDLDGTVQYSGTDPDTPFILQNVLAHPSNFLNFSTYQIEEQLPENND